MDDTKIIIPIQSRSLWHGFDFSWMNNKFFKRKNYYIFQPTTTKAQIRSKRKVCRMDFIIYGKIIWRMNKDITAQCREIDCFVNKFQFQSSLNFFFPFFFLLVFFFAFPKRYSLKNHLGRVWIFLLVNHCQNVLVQKLRIKAPTKCII